MNRTGYWLTLQTHRYCGQSLQLHVWEPKPQQRKTSLGEEPVRGKESYNASREMTNLKWKNILKKKHWEKQNECKASIFPLRFAEE